MRRKNGITLARPFMLTPEQASTAKPSHFFAVAPQKNTFESAMANNIYTHIYDGFFHHNAVYYKVIQVLAKPSIRRCLLACELTAQDLASCHRARLGRKSSNGQGQGIEEGKYEFWHHLISRSQSCIDCL